MPSNAATISPSRTAQIQPGRLSDLTAHGQSCWLDDLSRAMIASGELARMVGQGVRGVTANPATFGKAIMQGPEYCEEIAQLGSEGRKPSEVYERLAFADVRAACDIFRSVYEQSGWSDGFVSLEVSPHLAHDTAGSISEAQRFWAAVDRPNLFITIPGTQAGLPAIEELLFQGININITLLFSVARYEDVARAHLRALERRAAAGERLDNIASVASFFLSRIDVLVDPLLQQQAVAVKTRADWLDPKTLLGKTAIASAKLAYRSLKRLRSSSRWRVLAAEGARVQRLLWASTGTKNPNYPELMYVEPLIAPETINTMPDQTIAAFLDHGTVAETAEQGVEDAVQVMGALNRLGIDFDYVATQLENQGIQKFIEPYEALMRHLGAAGHPG